MSTAVERLMEEHRMIRRVLDALDAFVAAIDRADRGDLGRFVAFLREYADTRHHAKEEQILFEEMIQAGFPREAGPIAVMLHEHGLFRGMVGRLATIAASDPWPDDASEQVAEIAYQFTELLRSHMDREDQILYPMAMSRLPADAMQRVNDRVRAFDNESSNDGARLEELATELVERYL